MFLLGIVVAAVLVFFTVLILLGVAHVAEDREKRRRSLLPCAPFTVLSLSQAFDPDTAMLWETQAPALQMIERAGWRGIAVRRLEPFYEAMARTYPELYDGSSFVGWVQFLGECDLVVLRVNRLVLTEAAKALLRYRVLAPTPSVHFPVSSY